MAYKAPNFIDRAAVGDNKYKMEQLPDGRVILTPAPDSVAAAGTDINKAIMQPLADAVEALDTEVYVNIPADIEDVKTDIKSGAISSTKGWETISLSLSKFNSSKVYKYPLESGRYILCMPSSLSVSEDSTYTITKSYNDGFLVIFANNPVDTIWISKSSYLGTERLTGFGTSAGRISLYSSYVQDGPINVGSSIYISIAADGLEFSYSTSYTTISSISGTLKILQL